MYGVMYGVILWHIMSAKVGPSFASDIDTESGSSFGGGFEVGVEYEVVSDNVSSVNNDGRGEVD